MDVFPGLTPPPSGSLGANLGIILLGVGIFVVALIAILIIIACTKRKK